MDVETLIKKYIKSKEGSWSPTTLRTEAYRLRGLKKEHLIDPETLWNYLKKERGLKPYALKTSYIRASELAEYAMRTGFLPKGANLLKEYMRDHALKFRAAYEHRPVGISFSEAAERINSLPAGIREKAVQLLATGMRISESMSLSEEGTVVGKGGRVRVIPLASEYAAKEFDKSETTLRRALKKIGLTPHQLRKLCATELVKHGASEADLMQIMGWRTSQMAAVYVQAERQRELTEKISTKLKGVKIGK